MENENKKSENNKEIKEWVKLYGRVLTAGVIGGALMGVAYIAGRKAATIQINRGLDRCCIADPSFKEHLIKAIEMVK